jgi:uncharacterized protein YkuJ
VIPIIHISVLLKTHYNKANESAEQNYARDNQQITTVAFSKQQITTVAFSKQEVEEAHN